ncbi:hypothetical protein NHX12_016038 [Muraenolepis orangiensis]|uniref:Deleted in malignant brain tumors 1 protein n=1 Tax=Muraenolepis orangiensis TaxID=630683 RepID=A0A9Q0I1E4_9TELE|nr:hypothetical protein NHX12_016038 [Muraenolepis orangiensis]
MVFGMCRLEDCCGCDYVSIFDGPSVNSRLLGKLCEKYNTVQDSFQSSSTQITVLFWTDGSVSGRGFNANFTSSLTSGSAQPSCRYNCGRNMGSCSCSSSCQYYGNCCYDYYWHPCGGYLSGSGSLSSPGYPGSYPHGAYCVWQLTALPNHRIFLSFTDFQLENCCGCDYVSVFDGPSVNSRLLGKLCEYNHMVQDSFQSSSTQITVLFRTDWSISGRGFNANFTSALTSGSGRVECSGHNMDITIEKSYLNSMGYAGNNLYLNDPYCRPRITAYQVIFSFPINTCGTIRTLNNGSIAYTNSLRAHKSDYGLITRQSSLKLDVDCRMEPDTTVQVVYVAGAVGGLISGMGRFNGSMAFYTSGNFVNEVTQVPYVVTLNQNLYVQVNLRWSDSSLVLFLDTCVASPSPHDFHNISYDLVRNGCVKDSSYYAYASGYNSDARFTFRAFQFLRTHESVYLQCKVVICLASDYNSRCRRGCSVRKARALMAPEDSHTLVLGPITLHDPQGQGEGSAKEEVEPEKSIDI